jgi:predicted MPP superfamily phosphohydrolase
MSQSTVKTRIFIISDTHSGVMAGQMSYQHSFHQPFPKADVLLHTGDLTMTGTPLENRDALALLASIPAELKLVIAGNHDLSLDRDYYLNSRANTGELWAKAIGGNGYKPENADIVHEIWTGDMAKTAGVTYLTEGMHQFELSNGAQLSVYASPWQPKCKAALLFPTSKLSEGF